MSSAEMVPYLKWKQDVAEHDHRLSLAYALDPYTQVPLKLVS